jgi:hypothetical protein
MEVVARDLKTLGLYTARALSFDGVEYDVLEHALTPAQIEIYDAYAGAFRTIHHNLEAALTATGVNDASGETNASAAYCCNQVEMSPGLQSRSVTKGDDGSKA